MQRCEQLCNKMYNLGELVTMRKTNFKDNTDFLRFLWRANVIESWITYKDARGDGFWLRLSSVQTLLTKQEMFDIRLKVFGMEGIQNIIELKDHARSSEDRVPSAIEEEETFVKEAGSSTTHLYSSLFFACYVLYKKFLKVIFFCSSGDYEVSPHIRT